MDDRLQGKWKQLKGSLKTRWGKLTDDDIKQIEGNKDKLVGKIQELYGTSREEVSKAVQQLFNEHHIR